MHRLHAQFMFVYLAPWQAQLYQSVNKNARRTGVTARWQKVSCALRQNLGLAREARPWTGRAGVTMPGTPKTPRVLDVLDLGYAHMS